MIVVKAMFAYALTILIWDSVAKTITEKREKAERARIARLMSDLFPRP